MQETGSGDGFVFPGEGHDEGRLADNLVHFSRVLRRAGIRTGTGASVDAIAAVKAIGIGSREEFHAQGITVSPMHWPPRRRRRRHHKPRRTSRLKQG